MSSWFQNIFKGQTHVVIPAHQSKLDPTKDDLDSVLAEGMHNLSLDERKTALEETNGIPQNVYEDPIAIETGLWELDSIINTVKQGTVYEVAEAMNRSYVTCRDFRLMFLRSTRYDPQVASENIIKYLEVKRNLFGQSKLVKKITLKDLGEDERKYLKSGCYQILPSKDSAGRKILLALAHLSEVESTDNVLRARFYAFQSLTESLETQLTGITAVFLALSPDKSKNGGNTGMLWCMPIHIGAAHGCFADIKTYVANSLLVYGLSSHQIASRTRVHYTSTLPDCQNVLSTFGIPRYLLPSSFEDLPTKDHHDRWFQQRCQMELTTDDASPTTKSIGFADKDVLFGHSQRIHSGNLQFRKHIQSLSESYNNATKKGKVEIAESAIEKIKSSGGRFLRQNSDNHEWEEVSFVEARNKVTHTFRNNRIKRGTKKQSG